MILFYLDPGSNAVVQRPLWFFCCYLSQPCCIGSDRLHLTSQPQTPRSNEVVRACFHRLNLAMAANARGLQCDSLCFLGHCLAQSFLPCCLQSPCRGFDVEAVFFFYQSHVLRLLTLAYVLKTYVVQITDGAQASHNEPQWAILCWTRRQSSSEFFLTTGFPLPSPFHCSPLSF